MRIYFWFFIPFALTLLVPFGGKGQDVKVLHYTETSGYDHGTRANSHTMFRDFGTEHGFQVVNDQTGSEFDALSNLQEYRVVIFSNTSGDQILDSQQRANFEEYMESGGAYLGIHAASDTYRHSSANGSNTGGWDWYAKMMGASVQQNPNHTAANHNGTIDEVEAHPSAESIPDPWNKIEEYYYWEKGYLDTAINPVLEVRSTGGASYDARRPMSWYRVLPNNGRVFYTALGHTKDDYVNDTSFRNHIQDALLWTMGSQTSVNEAKRQNAVNLFPNPATDQLFLRLPFDQISSVKGYRISDVAGKVRKKGKWQKKRRLIRLGISDLPVGQYFLEILSREEAARCVEPFVVEN